MFWAFLSSAVVSTFIPSGASSVYKSLLIQLTSGFLLIYEEGNTCFLSRCVYAFLSLSRCILSDGKHYKSVVCVPQQKLRRPLNHGSKTFRALIGPVI